MTERNPDTAHGSPRAARAGHAAAEAATGTLEAPRSVPPSPAAGELVIRKLAYADLPQVMAIERRAFPTPWSLAMFVLELSKPSGICLAAMRGDRIVGYLVCSRYDRVWHLMNVAVDPGARRRGIAVALLRRLFEEADEDGAQYTLEVRTSNKAAIAMYGRLNFRPAGRRRGYYHDNREDALVMWRTAGASERPPASPA